MRKRILTYRLHVDMLLEQNEKDTDWDAVLGEHLVQIGFFQHERLVHLIVTALFAILFVMSIGVGLTADYPAMFLVTGVLLLLLIPYIAHYYLLENEVQKMYGQYDRMMELKKRGNRV